MPLAPRDRLQDAITANILAADDLRAAGKAVFPAGTPVLVHLGGDEFPAVVVKHLGGEVAEVQLRDGTVRPELYRNLLRWNRDIGTALTEAA